MKMEHYENYSAEDTARSESALLTVWAVLGDLVSDLVLVVLCRSIVKWSCQAKTSTGPM